MVDKNTVELENELRRSDNLEEFEEDNAKNFREYTLPEYLRRLLVEKNLSKAQVINDSKLGAYAYHIFDGTKKTSRKNILSLAFAMKLSPEETNYLLYYAGHKKLYVRDGWDRTIFFTLNKGYDIDTTNEFLAAKNLSPMLGGVD